MAALDACFIKNLMNVQSVAMPLQGLISTKVLEQEKFGLRSTVPFSLGLQTPSIRVTWPSGTTWIQDRWASPNCWGIAAELSVFRFHYPSVCVMWIVMQGRFGKFAPH